MSNLTPEQLASKWKYRNPAQASKPENIEKGSGIAINTLMNAINDMHATIEHVNTKQVRAHSDLSLKIARLEQEIEDLRGELLCRDS